MSKVTILYQDGSEHEFNLVEEGKIWVDRHGILRIRLSEHVSNLIPIRGNIKEIRVEGIIEVPEALSPPA